MLSFTSGSNSWRATVRAANLVSDTGTADLPAPRGTIEFLDYPGPVGRHPVQQFYPRTQVIHKIMVFRDQDFVSRGRVRGVALYWDFRESSLAASVTSVNGRNVVAPWSWEDSEPGSPTDCTTVPWMEWRSLETDYGRTTWMNHLVHGWRGWSGEYYGLDWLDGVPANLETMYDKHAGRVRQYVMVPSYATEGLGIAEQTLPPDLVTKTMTTLVWFPKEEVRSGVARLSSSGRVLRGSHLESIGFDDDQVRSMFKAPAEPEPDMKMAVGGEIAQGIIPNPFGPNCWQDAPAVAFVCWPMTEARALEMLRGSVPSGRVTF